jgi:dienelactone hydrolase
MVTADEARALGGRYESAKQEFEAYIKERAGKGQRYAIMVTEELGLNDSETSRMCDEFMAAGFHVNSDRTGIEVKW